MPWNNETARRLGRAILAGLGLGVALIFWTSRNGGLAGFAGIDFDLYMRATRRWLETGVYFQPFQLAGPYAVGHDAILYPPVALWLFVPFTWLPAALWWAIPLGVTGYAIARLRPSPFAWTWLLACLAWPPSLVLIWAGNPVIWAMAALSVGVLVIGPAVFVLIKPSLGLFALWGIRHRRWWLWLAAFAVLCLPFGPMWRDWLVAITNSDGGLLYSIRDVPLLLLPVVAWTARGYLGSGVPKVTTSEGTGASGSEVTVTGTSA